MSPASTQETLSILAIDIGTDNTRTLLFDVVEEAYHFIAAGIAPSTHQAPCLMLPWAFSMQ
jgi:sugar (pentulose or hexulose) kinase